MKYRFKTRPRQYQAQALKRAFEHNGRYGLFLEPGTGKTKIAIDFAAALHQQGRARVVLVICQKTGHPVWEEQLQIHCPVRYQVLKLTGGSKEKIAALKRFKRSTLLTFVLLNYESSWRIEEALFRLRPAIIILDEAHKIKNRQAKQSRAIHRLIAALDPFRLLLTGTPIANKPLDLFSQYLAIDPSVFGSRWRPFFERYATSYGYFGQRLKYKNLHDLRRKARSRATVLTKEECLPWLKKPLRIELSVELGAKALKAYQEMEDFFVSWLDENETASAAIKLTQLLRLSQITGGYVKSDSGVYTQVGSEKFDVLFDKLEELIEAGEKVVVFSRFRHEIDEIERLCKSRRWKSWKYYGPVDKHREKYPWEFTRHKGPAVFIAQTATGSLSIDLTAAAYGIFYSFDFSLVNWEQCHDRIDRGGQTRKVTFYYLLAKGTYDLEILAALRAKRRVASILENGFDSRAPSRDNATVIKSLHADAVATALEIFNG